jgi:hypothetical protein
MSPAPAPISPPASIHVPGDVSAGRKTKRGDDEDHEEQLQHFRRVRILCQQPPSLGFGSMMPTLGIVGMTMTASSLSGVMAHGTAADTGLPGVRQGSRPSSQHIVSVEGMSLANVLPNLDRSVNSVVWNTRGWTYQECSFPRENSTLPSISCSSNAITGSTERLCSLTPVPKLSSTTKTMIQIHATTQNTRLNIAKNQPRCL